jgi:hypothetical protein
VKAEEVNCEARRSLERIGDEKEGRNTGDEWAAEVDM